MYTKPWRSKASGKVFKHCLHGCGLFPGIWTALGTNMRKQKCLFWTRLLGQPPSNSKIIKKQSITSWTVKHQVLYNLTSTRALETLWILTQQKINAQLLFIVPKDINVKFCYCLYVLNILVPRWGLHSESTSCYLWSVSPWTVFYVRNEWWRGPWSLCQLTDSANGPSVKDTPISFCGSVGWVVLHTFPFWWCCLLPNPGQKAS